MTLQADSSTGSLLAHDSGALMSECCCGPSEGCYPDGGNCSAPLPELIRVTATGFSGSFAWMNGVLDMELVFCGATAGGDGGGGSQYLPLSRTPDIYLFWVDGAIPLNQFWVFRGGGWYTAPDGTNWHGSWVDGTQNPCTPLGLYQGSLLIGLDQIPPGAEGASAIVEIPQP
jgi:hypothetical protein